MPVPKPCQEKEQSDDQSDTRGRTQIAAGQHKNNENHCDAHAGQDSVAERCEVGFTPSQIIRREKDRR